MKSILLVLFMMGITGPMRAEDEKKIVNGVLESLKFPEDWKVTAESSYNDSIEGKVIVRRSLLLDISKLIPDGVGLPNAEDASFESKLFYAKLAQRFREDICVGLKPLTAAEFNSMDLDQKPTESATTTIFYNQDCVVTVMSEPYEVDGDAVLWSVRFAVAFDVDDK